MYDSLLFDLLLLAKIDSLLYLLSLDLLLTAHLVDPLLLILLHHLVHPQLLHLLVDLDLVLLLQRHHFVRTLLRLLNLLPGAHLFLLEQGDTVGKELSVSLDTTRARGLARNNTGF